MIAKIWAKYDKFLKYCLIGVSSVALDFAFFSLLIAYSPLHYQVANVLAISLGISNSFFWNARFNFRVFDRYFRRYTKFYAVGVTGMAVSAFLLFVLHENLGVSVFISKFVTIFAVTVLQFSLNKRYSLA